MIKYLICDSEKRSRNKNVKIIISHMSQVIQKDRWGICSHFSLGCCKSVRYDSKGCCSNNMLAGRGGLAPFLLGCFWGWGGGVGCQRSCYADDVTLIIWGWGGVGWDVNVHVTLMMLR